ncbi:MAG: PQ-loop domain-containing transporter [Candidatus Woesearchaeota archaeon]
MIVGIIGASLIAFSWIPQIIDLLNGKVEKVSLKFSLIYVIGSLLLVIYSIQLMDYVFILLNSFALLFSLMNLIFAKMNHKLV